MINTDFYAQLHVRLSAVIREAVGSCERQVEREELSRRIREASFKIS